jgi:hopanoid biosynthesis associated protein HpnK
VRRLIINADDFGLTSGVNRAIVEAASTGIVTSATLMANAAAFNDAVANADRLAVGCHVVLVDGSPLMGTLQVPTLLDDDGIRFRKSAGSLALAAWRGRLNASEVTLEASAQISRLQSAGIRVTHIDTHKHVHMFPAILPAVLSAAKQCGVGALRNPFEPLRFSQFAGKQGSRLRWLQVKALHALASQFRKAVHEAGMITTDGTLGIVATGTLDHEQFRNLVENCPEGTWELVCHPGYADRDLQRAGTRLQQSRALELQVLTSSAARNLVERCGIQLISYADLG